MHRLLLDHLGVNFGTESQFIVRDHQKLARYGDLREERRLRWLLDDLSQERLFARTRTRHRSAAEPWFWWAQALWRRLGNRRYWADTGTNSVFAVVTPPCRYAGWSASASGRSGRCATCGRSRAAAPPRRAPRLPREVTEPVRARIGHGH